MQIVIITGPFLPVPPAPCGAVERMWQELAEEFSAQTHPTVLLCRAHPNQASNETVEGVRYVRRMHFKRSANLYTNLLMDLIYSLRMLVLIPSGDIIVTNTFWLPILLPLFRKSAGKVVVNVNRMPKGQIKWYRHAARITAVSYAVQEAIASQCESILPITRIIPNTIDTRVFVPPEQPRNYQGILNVLYAGRIHPEKGLHLLIAAFRLVASRDSRLHLRIIGPIEVAYGGGGTGYLQKLQAIAGSCSVEFLPPEFDKHALARVYQDAHYFCYPSLAETGESFGLAPLEAMSTGLVPIVSNLACFKDFVEHGVTGMIFDHRLPDNTTQLANTLTSLVTNPELTSKIGDNAAQRAQAFGKERIAADYLADFETLLAK